MHCDALSYKHQIYMGEFLVLIT